jgi:hypothetical protein
VSQLFPVPLSYPVLNHCWRWADVPWVKLCGSTRPPLRCCSVSSPIFAAVSRPCWMSYSVMLVKIFWPLPSSVPVAFLAQTPA